ncbi:MAG: YidC/Oxa1 family insertase periplasmic-domain containing protein [Firmicutes bacterium]|nr:YidC/Oxa1 family insertase periplasmic-domain containing protein [Bacillota bacterium]
MLFIVLSMGLLGIYYALTPKPQPVPPAAVAQASAPSTEAAAPAPLPAAPAAPAMSVQPVTDPKALVAFENAELKLQWRKSDGALQQVLWKKDGTPFFPEETRDAQGHVIAPAFLGMGGAPGLSFGEPELKETEADTAVQFRAASGEVLIYRVPKTGHVLHVEWQSPTGRPLSLLQSLKEVPKTPEGKDFNPLHSLSRVFTLNEKSIDALPWAKTMEDHWYGKRKPLPPATSKLGMDAGIEKNKGSQRSHYFTALWDVSAGTVRLDAEPAYHLVPGADGRAQTRLYLGPKRSEDLADFNPAFTQIVDFGFFGLVAKAMFWILFSIQKVVPNWGWAIVIFSILLRLALWPLNTKTTVQMMRMKDLEPQQKAIQAKYEKFGNDMQKKAEMQKELMAFYKKNGHNPMGGCLPMLLQMPVFFALWSMLNAVFELRHAQWILWIQDLSAPDKFYALPILLGLSMIVQSWLTPATGDPMQRKMMMFLMPAMMVFFFANTPAGLCLYYLVFNLVGLAQTWWVVRTYKPQSVIV